MGEEAEAPSFVDVLRLVMFVAAAWGGGRVAERAGAPALIGEIAAGVVLGRERPASRESKQEAPPGLYQRGRACVCAFP